MSLQKSQLHAIGYSILGFSLWVVCDVFQKLAGQSHLPFFQLVFIFAVVSGLTIMLYSAGRRRLCALKPNRWKLEILRSTIGLVQAIANVFAFTNLPLTTVYVAVFLSPMMIGLLAHFFLDEKLKPQQIAAIIVGFIGVVIAIDPLHIDLSGGNLAGYLALPVCLTTFSLGMFMLRPLGKTETSESLAFFPSLFRALVLLPFCLWHFEPMTGSQMFYTCSLGIFSGLGWVAMSQAYKRAPAAIVAPFHYSQIVTGALAGYLVFGDVPSIYMFAGAVLIIGSGLYIARLTQSKQGPVEQS